MLNEKNLHFAARQFTLNAWKEANNLLVWYTDVVKLNILFGLIKRTKKNFLYRVRGPAGQAEIIYDILVYCLVN